MILKGIFFLRNASIVIFLY